MADFRRKEYRGSLLLVQECGPVDIVVDTDAKTVTPSLAKADSSYSIAGGGASLEYVIPEQTILTTTDPSDLHFLTDETISDHSGQIIIKATYQVNQDYETSYGTPTTNNIEVDVFGTTDKIMIMQDEDSGKWYVLYLSNNTPVEKELKLSAIAGF